MGCSATVVNDAKTNTERSAAYALDPISQARSEGRLVTTHGAGSAAIGEFLLGLRENDQGRAKPLCQLCCYARDRTLCECRANWACGSSQSRSPCETCRIRASARKGAGILGCV